jgi:hypothetical protein
VYCTVDIFWAGAINPAGSRPVENQATASVAASNSRPAFTVREIPVSLHQLVLNYDTLTPSQEIEFLGTLQREIGFGLSSAAQMNVDADFFGRVLASLILESQVSVHEWPEEIQIIHPLIFYVVRSIVLT